MHLTRTHGRFAQGGAAGGGAAGASAAAGPPAAAAATAETAAAHQQEAAQAGAGGQGPRGGVGAGRRAQAGTRCAPLLLLSGGCLLNTLAIARSRHATAPGAAQNSCCARGARVRRRHVLVPQGAPVWQPHQALHRRAAAHRQGAGADDGAVWPRAQLCVKTARDSTTFANALLPLPSRTQTYAQQQASTFTQQL